MTTELSGEAHTASRGAAALVLLQTLARLPVLAFVVFAARQLGPSQFGRYSTAAAALVVAGFLSDFGTTSATAKLVSSGDGASDLLEGALAPSLVLGLLAWAAGTAALAAVGYSRVNVVDFAVLGVVLPFDACGSTICGALDGSGRSGLRALVVFTQLATGFGAAVALVSLTGSVRWAMVGVASGYAVGLAVGVGSARRVHVWSGKIRIDFRQARRLLTAALPFAAITGFGVIAARFDVLVVSALYSSARTASYDVALRGVEALLYIVNLFSGPSLFIFTRRLQAGDFAGTQRAFARLGRVFMLISLPLSAELGVLSGAITRAAFGPGYEAAVTPLTILGAQLVVMFGVGLQGLLLASLPRMSSAVKLVAFMTLSGLALQVGFIALWGVVGAAAAIAICQFAALVAQGALLRRKVGFFAIPRPPLGALVAAGACAAACRSLHRAPLAVAALAGVLIYGTVVLVSGAVGRDDLDFLRQIARPAHPPQ